jgi:hypothetical protein
MIVVVTRLSPRGARGLQRSLALSGTVVGQLGDLPGFGGGRLLVDRRADLWTLTTWHDRAALAAFREVHAPVMAQAADLARASSTTAWQTQAGLPSWSDVRERWTDGRGPARGPGLGRVLAPARAARRQRDVSSWLSSTALSSHSTKTSSVSRSSSMLM